ncbi:MAG: hypothetical protein HYW48_07120 [Deltaproteobacteria bacterium]|nr:hypothetical protein [Deltaproteobacteria bacterium]
MSALDYSVFKFVFFPSLEESRGEESSQDLRLRRAIRFSLDSQDDFRSYPFVVFDLETTGLDSNRDKILEIGAQKIVGFSVVDEMSTLISAKIPPSALATVERISGITPDMLTGQPSVEEVLPRFLEFIKGSILVAHNASFDMGFIRAECLRQGVELDWPVFCTLKMAREILARLARKNLDTLAEHYGFSFEARHRSIGDVKVTVAVLRELLMKEASHLLKWADMSPYRA